MRVRALPLQKDLNRCAMFEDFDVPHKMQPGEYSKGGGMDDIAHKRALGRECELERRQRRLEYRSLLGSEPEQVECRQSGRLSQLSSFSRPDWGGSFR